jgi:uncharacterized membrane protein
MTETSKAHRGRFLALDLLRFLAVVLMVQGHTFREVLVQSVRDTTWFSWHEYIHGFTAPIFLFSSGLAFGITTFRGWEKHLSWGPTLKKRFERYILLLLIGYWIHLPRLSIKSLMEASPERLAKVFKVDALQNIGVTLLLAELLVIALRTPKRFVRAASALGIAFVLAAPFLGQLSLEGVPIFFAGFINRSTGSFFPLAPYSAFLLAGIVTAYFLYDAERAGFRERSGLKLLVFGCAVAGFGKLMTELGADAALFGDHNVWVYGPFFFLVRIGVVWAVLGALALLTELVPHLLDNRPGRFLQLMGQETLVIYVSHLFILWGSAVNSAVAKKYKYSLDVFESTLCFLAVFAVTMLIAKVWNLAKTRQPTAFDYARWAVTATLALVFVLRY